MFHIDMQTARWLIGGGFVAIMVLLAVGSRREYRRVAELDASREKLAPGADNKAVDEDFAATLEKDPDA